jgi:hypothetical protein
MTVKMPIDGVVRPRKAVRVNGAGMDVLQKSLDRALTALPELFLEKSIAKKLQDQGIKGPKSLSHKIARHILSGKTQPLKLGSKHPDITLTFNEADANAITRDSQDFLKTGLPKLLPQVASRLSKGVLRNLKSRWAEEHALQNAELSGFRERLEERWGKPLDQLRMLLTIAREWGQAVHAGQHSTKGKNNVLNHILLRLHVRGCQVTDEIICLLENGFADGAMARWRTLHELSVVAAVISQYGDSIAERYLAHQAVDSRRAMNKYMKCCALLGYRPLSGRQVKKITRAYHIAIAKYGKEFESDFGWATHHLKKKRVTFADLEAEAGRTDMRSYYQMASDNVHAGVKSLFIRLGLLDDWEGLLAGRSNSGLMDPGQNAAHTLTQLSALVCLREPIFDDLVAAQVMRLLRDEIPKSFSRANLRLRKDDKQFRALTHTANR